MHKLVFVFLGVISLISHAVAQCNGVYFKETNRQVFSNGFAYNYIEDLDGDGLKDIFGFTPLTTSNSNFDTYKTYFYKRINNNEFDTNAKISDITNFIPYSPFGIFGDVNNDNKKDLVVVRTNGLTTYLNDGSGRFLTTTPVTARLAGESFWAAGDINNDGKADLVSSVPVPNSSTLYYRLAQPDFSFGPPITIMSFPWFIQNDSYNNPDYRNQATIEDINNDGFNDIVFRIYGGASGDKLGIAINNGTTFLDRTVYDNFPLYDQSKKLRPIDLNNDGKKDFVSRPYRNVIDPNLIKIKILLSNENNYAEQEIVVPSNYYYIAKTKDYMLGDFDGDELNDIILQGEKKYLLLKNLGNANFNQQEYNSYLNVNSVDSVNLDNKSDAFTLTLPYLRQNYYMSSSNRAFDIYKTIGFRQNTCNPVGQTKTVDFNGDGITDRAFWNPATGVWRYYPNQYPDNSSNDQVSFQWGSGALGDIPVPNDYDGDGKTDYAVFRKPTGTWYILRSSDQQYYAFPFGLAEDKPIPSDYDGDSKADIAVYRPSEGNWYIWLSQTNQFYAANFGISEDKPVPADYDGDGKSDISVYRPSSGTWYRLNSSSNNSFFAFQYGINTDKPIPADYDGDGRANIAVYRDGIWFVLGSDYSTSVLYWGTINDTPMLPESYYPNLWVFRRNANAIYDTSSYYAIPTGSSLSETFVSNILVE